MKVLQAYFFCLYSILLFGDVSCKKQETRVKKSDGKIVGGSVVSITKRPYQAHLLIQTDRGDYTCGGSIISPTFILTAAHCLPEPNKVYVRVGSDYANDGGDVIESTDFNVHPNYSSSTMDNDIGLIRLSSPIQYDNKKRPIKLPARGANIPRGTKVSVSGWGTTSENGDPSNVLMVVTVPAISNAQCRLSYPFLTENMLCAGLPRGGKDSCQGDSGGPAVANDQIIGVVSFGVGCARPRYPGVYARVSSYGIRDWIKQNAGV